MSVCDVCSLGFVRIIGVNYGQVRQPVAAFMPRLLLRLPSSCSPRRNPTGSAGPLCHSVPKKKKKAKKEGKEKEKLNFCRTYKLSAQVFLFIAKCIIPPPSHSHSSSPSPFLSFPLLTSLSPAPAQCLPLSILYFFSFHFMQLIRIESEIAVKILPLCLNFPTIFI